MIHLEIIAAQDSLSLGLYEFEFDTIHVGRSKKNDLIFLDRKLPTHYLQFHIAQDISGDHLVVKSLTRSPFFFVNGKKVSGTLKVRPNDIISFEGNQIKVVHFKRTKAEKDLGQAFLDFNKNASELRFSIDFIEEVLMDLETKQDQNKNKHV